MGSHIVGFLGAMTVLHIYGQQTYQNVYTVGES